MEILLARTYCLWSQFVNLGRRAILAGRQMREQQLLSRLVGVLERSGAPYLFTGSFASSLQGTPRAAGNLDLVARLEAGGLRELKRAFPPPEFELDEEAALQALARGDSFPLVDREGGGRVDFWPASDSPFDRSRFARRQFEDFQGLRIALSSPEDTILVKLYWGGRSGEREKQFVDALGVYELQSSRLDKAYLRRWAAELGVAGELGRLEKQAQRLG
jgi:hypothetical protein